MIWSNIRLGLRLLAKRPGQTAIAILMLSLGIGLTVTTAALFFPLEETKV